MLLNNKDDALVAALGASLEPELSGRSPWAAARHRFMRNKAAVVSLMLLLAITLLCGAATAAAGPIGFVGLVVPHVLRLVVATLAPIVPLALTMMSFEELLKTLFGVLF